MNASEEDWSNLLQRTASGLYCPAGDFYIDPWKNVPKAVITHAHSDHARFGSDRYLACHASRHLLTLRLGASIQLQTLAYGERLRVGQAQLSFHPAGHILGSAQVRIEVAGRVALVTGDYKLQPDPTCAAWEQVPCDLMVTESTFGLPVFRWPDTECVIAEIIAWWRENQNAGRPSLLYAYAVGKSQRLIAGIAQALDSPEELSTMYVHGALIGPNQAYRDTGIAIPSLASATAVASRSDDWRRALIIAPPSAQNSPWIQRFGDASDAMASGWMAIRGTRRRRALDRGFVLSDHVDWPDLMTAIDACAPREVWVTHGFSEIVARYQAELGRAAHSIETQFVGDDGDGETARTTDAETPTQDGLA